MVTRLIIMAMTFVLSAQSFSDSYYARQYEVTIINITKGETFTPILSATHKSSIQFFELGNPSSEPLAILAESGDVMPLKDVLDGSDLVADTTSTQGLLAPGNAVTFKIFGDRTSRLSFAAMLIPTNDTFVALNTVRLPRYGSRTYFARAYDAGSEINDELCANIPGPACGGEGNSPTEDGEGFVHISAGIHGEGDLSVSTYDWRDAVAKVVVRRIR